MATVLMLHVPVRSGRTDDQVRDEMLTALVDWIDVMGPVNTTARSG
jgi:hypothetical protein